MAIENVGDPIFVSGPAGPASAATAAALTDVQAALKAVLTAADLPSARTALGLGNVANTAPADLPVSSATAQALGALAGQVAANASALATILGGANPAIDTFIEAYQRFVADESAAAALLATVNALQTALTAEVTRAQAAEQANATAIGNNATAIANEVNRATNVEGTLALKARQVLAAGLATGGGDLSADRTISVPKASAAMASAGTDDASAVTPLALAAPLAGKVGAGRQVLAAGLATGGGDLSADRTITVPKASAAMASAGTDDASAVTPLALATPLAGKVGTGRQVATPVAGGLTGGGDLSADRNLSIAANGVTNAMLAQAPTLTLKANLLGSTAGVTDQTLSAILDAIIGSGRGTILVRGASAWSALALGANGQTLQSNGSDLVYAASTPGTGAARYDTAQSLTLAQQRQLLTNAGASNAAARQTVLSGPTASGAPSFLPASVSGSLTLTMQNLAAASPLVTAIAAGFDGAAAIDIISAITTNLSQTLAASSTLALYIDAGTGTTPSLTFGAGTLFPIWQYGTLNGPISTVNGQYTFDFQAMQGWIGTGSAAIKCNRVYIGEAVTSASAITSVIAYPYGGYLETAWVAGLPANSSITSLTTNLGYAAGAPFTVEIVAQCTTAESGFAVGTVLNRLTTYQSTGTLMTGVQPSLTRNTLKFTCLSDGWIGPNLTTAQIFTLTRANWSWKAIIKWGARP